MRHYVNTRILILFTMSIVSLLLVSPTNVASQPILDDIVKPNEVKLDSAGDGECVSLTESQELVITLPGNPATGFIWQVSELDSDVLRRDRSGVREFEMGTPEIGGDNQQVLRFLPIGEGKTNLKLVYRRPWLEDTEPASTYTVKVQTIGPFTGVNTVKLNPTQPAVAVDSTSDTEVARLGLADLTVPSVFNWCDQGGCTAVKDQLSCGSCWAFATVGVMESAIKIHDGISRDLSEQYLVSCNTNGWGCSGGNWAHDYHIDQIPYGELAAGAVNESDFLYQASDVSCNAPHTHHEKLDSWAYVDPTTMYPSVASIKQAIVDHGPVAVGVCVGDEMVSYTGGIFSTDERNECWYDSYYYTNHAVILTGWDDSQGVWIMRNSWGSGWGENGYMRIKYGTSLVGEEANYVVYTGSEPPTTYAYQAYLPIVIRGGTQTTVSIPNGDFESGPAIWTQYSSHGWALIVENGGFPGSVTAHSGQWATWLGGDYDEISYIQQKLTVPADNHYLSYWHWVVSEDICGYDFAGVIIGDTVVDVYDLCESTNTYGWVNHTVNLQAYSGQEVWLQVRSETDNSLNSNLFIDDVSFTSNAAVTSGAPEVNAMPPNYGPHNEAMPKGK